MHKHKAHKVASNKQGAASRKEGALQTKTDGPWGGVVGWFLGGQKSTRAGQFFCEIFYRVFEPPSPRNAQKRD
jgi:hypothetical protein